VVEWGSLRICLNSRDLYKQKFTLLGITKIKLIIMVAHLNKPLKKNSTRLMTNPS